MRLTEDDLQTGYVQKFKDARYPKDIAKVIKQFCKDFGFPNYKEQDFNTFIDNNLYALQLECNQYNLSSNNPFFQFLVRYLEVNSDITPFINQTNWGILHNCISNGILTTKQLSFKCPATEEIKILLNKNLWGIKPSDDILYLIKLYNWFLEENLNRYVINGYVRAIFSKIDRDNKIDFKSTDNLDKLDNKIALINLTFFSQEIKQITENAQKRVGSSEYILSQLNAKRYKFNKDAAYRTPFESVDMIENQVEMLQDQVQENSETYKYENPGTDKDTDGTGKQDKYTKSYVRQVIAKSQPIIDTINKTYGNSYTSLSKSDLRDILNILSDNLE